MQQSDRAGRDGTQSTAFWLYQGMQLMHVKRDIKDYVKSKECRHKHLLDYFDMECPPSDPARLCCDHCSASCEFSLGDCKPLCYPLPAVDQPKVRTGGREGLAKEEGSIPAFGKRDILRPIIVYICISELSALFHLWHFSWLFRESFDMEWAIIWENLFEFIFYFCYSPKLSCNEADN